MQAEVIDRIEGATASGSNCLEYYTEWANVYDQV